MFIFSALVASSQGKLERDSVVDLWTVLGGYPIDI